MRIGVDACTWSNERGYGRFTRELLRAMLRHSPTDEFVLFADARTLEGIGDLEPNATRIGVEQSVPPALAASADGYRSPRDMLRLFDAVRRQRPDVFFSPSVYTYFPLPPGMPAVVTIHDTIAERFPDLTVPSRRARLFWNAKVALARLQSRLILTVSDYSARQIATVLRVPMRRIRVTSEAPAAAYRPSTDPAKSAAIARRIGLPPEATWINYVGGFNPHKRVDILIEAHARLVRELGDAAPYLVLVGSPQRDVFHSALTQLELAIERAGSGHRVIWAGFVPDAELAHLHSGALALALPSESEGFGLPAVEAAACGTPVVATTESPLPELLEGGGFFIPPGDADALTDALHRLATDPVLRRCMGDRALRQASRLSWPHSAGLAMAALYEAAS